MNKQSHAAMSQGMPGTARGWKIPRILPGNHQRARGPANTLISDFWLPELTVFFKPLGLWKFLQQHNQYKL
jgi:hypothetical protein